MKNMLNGTLTDSVANIIYTEGKYRSPYKYNELSCRARRRYRRAAYYVLRYLKRKGWRQPSK